MKNTVRRIFINIRGLKGYYILLALLSILCAAAFLFVAELLRSAILLRNASYLPYDGYYLLNYQTYKVEPGEFREIAEGSSEASFNTQFNVEGAVVEDNLKIFEAIDEYIVTKIGLAKTELWYITNIFERSKKPSGELPWTVTPNSEFDEAFRKGKRVLLSGRHLKDDDFNSGARYALLDEELANLNELSLGDKFSTSIGEEYEIIGIYRVLEAAPVIGNSKDVPSNMIYTSCSPEEFKSGRYRDFYLKLDEKYSESEIKSLADMIEYLTHGVSLFAVYEDEFFLTPVEEVNAKASAGVTSMIYLSFACAVLMLITVIAAVSAMISTLSKKRMREFLLYGALGQKSRYIIGSYGAEILTVALPSSIIGTLISAGFLTKYIKAIVEYFESMVTSETIHATSTISVTESIDVAETIHEQLHMGTVYSDGFLTVLLISAIAAVSVAVCYASFRKLPVMSIISER